MNARRSPSESGAPPLPGAVQEPDRRPPTGSGTALVVRIVVFLLVALAGCSELPTGRDEIEALRETLLQPEDRDPYGIAVSSRDSRRRAVERLRDIGTPQAVDVFHEFLVTYRANRMIKQLALVALGQIASPEAIEIANIEDWEGLLAASGRGRVLPSMDILASADPRLPNAGRATAVFARVNEP